MRIPLLLLCAALAAPQAFAANPEHAKSVQAWRDRAEQGLRRDNGWLTLAGRYPMKPGMNTFGTGECNDIVFPKGLGPERMGTITVQPGNVTVKLADGVTMTTKDGQTHTDGAMGT